MNTETGWPRIRPPWANPLDAVAGMPPTVPADVAAVNRRDHCRANAFQLRYAALAILIVPPGPRHVASLMDAGEYAPTMSAIAAARPAKFAETGNA